MAGCALLAKDRKLNKTLCCSARDSVRSVFNHLSASIILENGRQAGESRYQTELVNI